MSDEAWIFLGVVVTLIVAPLVALLISYLKKQLNLSDEASTAVTASTSGDHRPTTWNDAIVLLAQEITELKLRDNAWAMFTWELEHWGLKGWSRAPKPHEPMPARPVRLRPDDEVTSSGRPLD